MSFLPVPVPVDSHTRERAASAAPAAVPEVGLAWGGASEFSVLDGSEEAGEAERRAGMTIRWAAKKTYRDVTHDLSPVWRSYDVVRIAAADDPEVTVDVALTRSMLFPIREETMHYIGGGSYVVDPGDLPAEEWVVHSYVRLDLPPPEGEWDIVQQGLTEGEWPAYREELFQLGAFAGAMAWQTVFGSGVTWSR